MVHEIKKSIQKKYNQIDERIVEKITGSVDNPKEAILRFKNEKLPNIVVTVDLLTTGVDIEKISKFCKDKNIFGFEIFLKNIPEPNKKLRQIKKSFLASDYQKSERDFAFVIDKIFKIGALEKIIREVDENLIQSVLTFDVYEGENIPKDKKSVAINITLQAIDKTLSENDLDEISKKIIDTVNQKTGATIRS